MIKQKTIFIVNTVLIVMYIGVRLLMQFVPNRAERLRQAEAAIPDCTESPADNLWAYFLINGDFPLPDGYECPLSLVQGTFMMDERCAGYARDMIAAAENDGVKLTVVSAYRSVQKQQENLESYIDRLINEGHSPDEAEKIAHSEIAVPGTSEHNAGLSLDILTEDWWETHDDVTADFENTAEFRWLSEHAHEYGFILRYPKDAERATGYAYEPWHYRFVGLYYAEKIRESGLPLEYYYIGAEK